jgi:hypothetical protein
MYFQNILIVEEVSKLLYRQEIIILDNILKEILIKESFLLNKDNENILILIIEYKKIHSFLEDFLELSRKFHLNNFVEGSNEYKEWFIQFYYYKENISSFFYRFVYLYGRICTNLTFLKLIDDASIIHL